MKFKTYLETDKDKWEKHVLKFSQANFLQSWNWGKFQETLEKKITRLVVQDSNSVVAVCSIVREEAKRGTYLAIAGGPLLDWTNKRLIEFLFNSIKVIAQEQQAVFIRFRPQTEDSDVLRSTVNKLKARPANMHLTADLTLQLDLTKDGDQILKEMRKNTRSSIKKSERSEIEVRISDDKKEIKEFFKHQNELAQKHSFVPFSYKFLYEQFRVFSADNQAVLVHAYKDNHLLASAFVIIYNKEAVYHYGISTDLNRKLPGSYAVQWAAINHAKSLGCTRYNFWGIAPENEKEHRFAGVSLFKRGFGGREVKYLQAHDIALSPKYYFTYVFELFRRKIRRL